MTCITINRDTRQICTLLERIFKYAEMAITVSHSLEVVVQILH